MDLRNIIDEKVIVTDLKVKNKEEAILKMANLLMENGYVNDVESFIADIYEREKEGVTGIGNGIAIPHGKSKSVNKVGIAIANLHEPIVWESLDNQDVSTIFLFCVSDDNEFAKNHLVLLSRIAAKLADDDLLKKVKSAKKANEISECLING